MGRCLVLGRPAGREGGKERADRSPLMPCHAMPFLKLLRWYVPHTPGVLALFFLPCLDASNVWSCLPVCLPACPHACMPACLPGMQFLPPHASPRARTLKSGHHQVMPLAGCLYGGGGFNLELSSTCTAAGAPKQNRGSTPAFCAKCQASSRVGAHHPPPLRPCPPCLSSLGHRSNH